MSARAYVLGLGRGAATPPMLPPCGFHEPFNQSDFAAFTTQYTPLGGGTWFTAGVLSVSGGSLVALGDAAAADTEVAFGPDEFTPTGEFWLRIQYAIAGGATDVVPFSIDIYSFVGGVNRGQITVAGKDGAPGFGSGAAPYTSTGRHGDGVLLNLGTPDIGGGVAQSSTINSGIAAGSHTVILCASSPSAGVLKAELWHNAAAGAAAGAINTAPYTTMPTFNNLDADVQGAFINGVDTSISDIQMICAPRAADPFGIL